MTNVHTYILVEALNINQSNRDTLFTVMKNILHRGNGNNPAEITHYRTRLNGGAVIICARFDSDDISINRVKNRLANTFGVDAGDIGNTNDNQNAYGLEVIFDYNAVDRIRYIAFGYGKDASNPNTFASWAVSGDYVRQYLKAFAADWGEIDGE